jgi:prolipoprotein diacylglyceryltransferase
VVGVYLVSAGLVRFGIEFLRVNPRVVGPLSIAHVAALIAAAMGCALLMGRRQHG